MAYGMGNSMGNQPVIVFKEGTERTKDKEAQYNNIAAARAIADAVRSTLGPKGMDKMLVDSMGDVTITNDGVTILKEIDVQHPAAKMVVEVAKTQDTECGDGTTTAVVLAGELLKRSEELIEQNIHPTVITNGFKQAAAKAIEILNDISIDVSNDDEMLKRVSNTAMTGKSVGGQKEQLSDIAVKAVRAVADDEGVDVENIKVEKKVGGTISETEMVSGIVIDKQRVHPRMPKKVDDAKIALISSGMEIKKTEVDAQINISDPSAMGAFLEEEENTLREMADKVKASGANVVFCQKGVDDLVQHYMAKQDVFCIRRMKQSDMEKLARATSAKIVGNIDELTNDDLGDAATVEERTVGDEEMTFITGCKNPKSVSVIIRGGTDHVLDEVGRSLHDAVRVIAISIEDGKVVAGGGAPETELNLRLSDYASSVGGREQLAIEAFADAMESVPWTLGQNAGLDGIDVIISLKHAHEQNGGQVFGIDLNSGKAADMVKLNVLEPLRVKTQAINSAAEVANMILRIDDVIASKSAPPTDPMSDPSMGGMMGGMPGGMM